MASHHRIFISFAVEDKWARDYLVGQARNDRSPFQFIDKSLSEPFDEKWKTQCRTLIRSCDGTIALVSKDTKNAAGALWEVQTSQDEGIPVRGVYTTADDRPAILPSALSGVRVVAWTWPNIKAFLDSL